MTEGKFQQGFIYGDLGTVSYDSNKKSWEFSQRPGREYALRWLGSPLNVSEGSPLKIPEISNREKRVKSNRQFLQVHSTLGGLHSIYEADRILSEAITTALSFYDSSIGDILGSGKIYSVFQSDLKPVYACPSSQSGYSLRVLEACFEDLRLIHNVQDLEEAIRVPTLSGNVTWAGDGSLVRQVCFSDPDSDSSESLLLGVRFPKSTVVFEVKYRGIRVQSRGYSLSTVNQFSNLDIRRILEIPAHKKVDGGHVDFTFNPWDRQQVAVINQRGEWTVTQFKPRGDAGQLPYPFLTKYRGTIQAQPVEKGGIVDQDDVTDNQDGWARVRWVLNAHTLVLCTRTLLQFIDIKSESTIHVDFSRRKDPQWNLDVRIGRKESDKLFLLTTSSIFCIKLKRVDNTGAEAGASVSYDILLAVQHFRDPWDITMQMKVLEERNCTYRGTLPQEKRLNV
jgi:RNA polymerase I-specific transcription initiation factor RRN6